MEGPERRLRVLAESDSSRPALPSSSLDPRSDALVRIAALVAVHAAAPSYRCAVREALTVGVTPDEVIDTLIAVSATVGLARVVSATPGMANALGIDIDSALEELRRPLGAASPTMDTEELRRPLGAANPTVDIDLGAP